MIIQPIKELYDEGDNIIVANKKRICMIKRHAKDDVYLRCKFDELLENLEKCNLDRVQSILTNELFYEFINMPYVRALHVAYGKINDKENFIMKLKESYILRGVNSIKFAWTPIIKRYS